jgi:hypothetical protein
VVTRPEFFENFLAQTHSVAIVFFYIKWLLALSHQKFAFPEID